MAVFGMGRKCSRRAPPPYQMVSKISDVDEKSSSLIPNQTFANDCDEVRVVLVNSEKIFHFSQRRLQQRQCLGLLDMLKSHARYYPNEMFVLGCHTREELRKTFEHEDADLAMTLMAEWVDSGKLRPSIKHGSNEMLEYWLLLFIAPELAHESLYNAVMDEIHEWHHCTMKFPGLEMWPCLVAMSSQEPSVKVQNLLLEYWKYNRSSLYQELTRRKWEDLGSMQYLFVKLLASKMSYCDAEYERSPCEKKKRCEYHVHKATQPCRKKGLLERILG